MSSAKVDTFVFGAHSTQGASTSKVVLSGVTMHKVLQTADWSSDSTFGLFYFKTSHHSHSVSVNLARVYILGPSKSRDMEPEFSIMKWLRTKSETYFRLYKEGKGKISQCVSLPLFSLLYLPTHTGFSSLLLF